MLNLAYFIFDVKSQIYLARAIFYVRFIHFALIFVNAYKK